MYVGSPVNTIRPTVCPGKPIPNFLPSPLSRSWIMGKRGRSSISTARSPSMAPPSSQRRRSAAETQITSARTEMAIAKFMILMPWLRSCLLPLQKLAVQRPTTLQYCYAVSGQAVRQVGPAGCRASGKGLTQQSEAFSLPMTQVPGRRTRT